MIEEIFLGKNSGHDKRDNNGKSWALISFEESIFELFKINS